MLAPLLVSIVLLAGCRSPGTAAIGAATLEEKLGGNRLTIVFRASPGTDVLYLLDCLAGVEKCSRDAYEELGRMLGLSAGDRALVAEWGAIRQRYDRVIRISKGPQVGFPIDLDEEVSISKRLRIGGYEDFQHAARLLLLPADAGRATAIVRRFRELHAPYWQRTGRALVEPSLRRLAALARQRDLVGLFERIASFYGARLPDPPVVTFHLLARPRSLCFGVK